LRKGRADGDELGGLSDLEAVSAIAPGGNGGIVEPAFAGTGGKANVQQGLTSGRRGSGSLGLG
jgi:hypothetical protein